jgi:hypothetical protein
MAPYWSAVFARSRMGPGIFVVTAAHRPVVRQWLDAQDVPVIVSRDLYSPTITGWAVLDGGCTEIDRYGLTSLPSRIRVVGWQTLRLLVDELGLAGPRRVLPGERAVEIAELRRRHTSDAARDQAAAGRAELLATCADGASIRSAAQELLGYGPPETPLETARAEGPNGPMGPWRSPRWVEQQRAARQSGDE